MHILLDMAGGEVERQFSGDGDLGGEGKPGGGGDLLLLVFFGPFIPLFPRSLSRFFLSISLRKNFAKWPFGLSASSSGSAAISAKASAILLSEVYPDAYPELWLGVIGHEGSSWE